MAPRIGLACIQVVPKMHATGEWHAVLAVLPRSECDPEGSASPYAWPATRLPRTVVEVSDIGYAEWDLGQAEIDAAVADSPGLIAPTMAHAHAIVAAAREAIARGEDGDHGLLVHCHGGISRSVTAGYAASPGGRTRRRARRS